MTSSRKGITPRQTVLVLLLTALYLLVELAFNARLLDVAGSLDFDAVHGLENFGRGLSGVAVALFVLQYQLARRAKSSDNSPRTVAIVFWCAFAVVITCFALKLLVDVLVDTSSGSFRKAAAMLVVVRTEMLRGHAQIDGLTEDPRLFERPEGKAFAALFPALGVQIWDRVEKRLAPVKTDLMLRAIDGRFGGAQAFYKGPYVAALADLRKVYQGELPQAQLNALYTQDFEKAWADYAGQLRQHRWTPDTVPHRYHARVAAEMNRKLGVPRNWIPSDRAGFRTAVEQQVRRRLREHPGAVYDNGKVVASGLSWPAYVAHPINQKQLQQAFQLPSSIAVRHEYGSGLEFQERLYQPMVRANAARETSCLDLNDLSFLPGGENEARGRDAAQAVLVPPLALFCSLMGAIAHLAKLLYQAARLTVLSIPRLAPLTNRVILVPVAAIVGIVGTIAVLDNAITTSRAHRFIREQALAVDAGAIETLKVRTTLGAMHAIEIGQGYGYPVNDLVRMRVLGGFTFGDGSHRAQDPRKAGTTGPANLCRMTVTHSQGPREGNT